MVNETEADRLERECYELCSKIKEASEKGNSKKADQLSKKYISTINDLAFVLKLVK